MDFCSYMRHKFFLFLMRSAIDLDISLLFGDSKSVDSSITGLAEALTSYSTPGLERSLIDLGTKS